MFAHFRRRATKQLIRFERTQSVARVPLRQLILVFCLPCDAGSHALAQALRRPVQADPLRQAAANLLPAVCRAVAV